MSSENQKDQGGFRFDRMELAGSLGDLGTLVPLAAGMIVINGLSPSTVLLFAGLFYILSGLYYKLPVPVQPLKVVGAIAIASPHVITEPVIAAAGILFGAILLILSVTGLMQSLAKLFTKPVIRGIQLGLGLILLKKGIALISAAPLFVTDRSSEMSWTNLAIGVAVFLVVLVLLNNKKFPAVLAAIVIGIVAGLFLGGAGALSPAFGPTDIEMFKPTKAEFISALVLLVIPQIPLTIGNACMGTADTACSLFPDSPQVKRATPGRFAFTMGLINLPAGFFGAMPMCHGAGGLAAHYRFGARTGGSNLMIGVVFIVLALAFGKISLGLITLIPSGVLGVLLCFAGIELALLVRDVSERKPLFIVILVTGIGFATGNMAYAFGAGIVAELIVKKAGIEI